MIDFDPYDEEKRIFNSIRRENVELAERFDEASTRLQAVIKEIPLKEAQLKELELRKQKHITNFHLQDYQLHNLRNTRTKFTT